YTLVRACSSSTTAFMDGDEQLQSHTHLSQVINDELEGSRTATHPTLKQPTAFKPRSQRNLKKLSLTIPSSSSSPTSTPSGPATASLSQGKISRPSLSLNPPTRRASIVSLPPTSSTALYRKDETE